MPTGDRLLYRAGAGAWTIDAQLRVLRWCHTHATAHWSLARVCQQEPGSVTTMEVSFASSEDHMLFVLTNPHVAFA